MLLLTATTHKLELQTSAAVSVDYTASYVDHTTSGGTPGSSDGNVATATTVDLVAAPAASTQRQVKHLSVANVGAAANTVIIKRDNSGTERRVFRVTLQPDESVQYFDGPGFMVFDAAGRLKEAPTATDGYTGRTASYLKAGTAAEAVGSWYCTAKDGGQPGAWAPGTPGLAGRATDGTAAADNGCVKILNPASGANYLTDVVVTSSVAHLHELYDVVWVNSGIVVTTTTAQTINSVAFPARDQNGSADGEGFVIGLLVTTATTNAGAIANATVSYTNQAGTAGHTATLIAVAGMQIPATAVIGTVVWFRLQAGDTGVRSIQSVTLGTSLVAGAVSLFVAKKLASVAVTVANLPGQTLQGAKPGVRLYNGVCILGMYVASATTATQVSGSLTVQER